MQKLLAKLTGRHVASPSELDRDTMENQAKLDAISRSQAVIEFEMDGTILFANENFLNTVGYTLDEIRHRHHRIFVPQEERDSVEYKAFWESLRSGNYKSEQFRRITKTGEDIWIQASYNPILDENGMPFKVVKFAYDITEQVMLNQRQDVGDAVAESINQMVETIAEISSSVNQTASLASSTETFVQSTNDSVGQLDQNSQAIENVVEFIRKLADQTNLLALNATIESARAGEAGKSFGVVANEVKELAKQTAEATKNIEESVGEIRKSIASVVEDTSNVSSSISTVNENMISIASAVEEQSATMSTLNQTAGQLRE